MRKCAEDGCKCSEKYQCTAAGTRPQSQDQPGSMNISSDANKDMKMQPASPQMQINETMQMDKGSMDNQKNPIDMQMNEIQQQDKAEQNPKFGQFGHSQVPLPMQATTSPRPTLLEGIKVNNNQSDAVLTNEVRPRVNTANKFKRNIYKKK